MVVIGVAISPGIARAEQLVTFDDIKKISPRADDALARAIADAEDQFAEHGITTRLRMAHFLSQVMTETGGLKRLDENMNYSEATLIRVFSRRTISRAKAAEVARKPREVANWVYGARLGNRGRDTDDGWNYRGSGYIQLTGLSNFRKRGVEINLPIADDPELARQPDAGLRAALAYWSARNINAAADDHDRHRVRVLVNGPAAHGYAQAKVWFNKAWSNVFQAKEGAGFETGAFEMAGGIVEDEVALFDDIMRESGLVPDDFSSTESGSEDERAEALREFQAERGLTETGELDEATQEALLDPIEWRYRDAEVVVTPTETRNPEEGVEFNLRPETATESGALMSIEPDMGTGEVEENVQLTADESAALIDARSIYAEYEMGAASVEPETFVPFSVIGEDDRVAITDTRGFPERAIVQTLFNNGRSDSLCTGTMISKDTVLTAGHCIHSGTQAGRPYSNYRLVPGRNVGAAPFGRCGAIAAYTLSGWVNSVTSLEARYYDLGAIKLDCDIGLTTGWMGVTTMNDDQIEKPTIVHGYAADKAPPGRQWVSTDKLRILWDLKGFYQNDTFGGTSGSPVMMSDAGDYIVGVHTNGLHGEEPWASNNAFTRITPTRMSEIINWAGR
ncbi:trypsin-like serine protease [Litoreibacter arenae]|uniref:Serine protease n=1 Tax=Litoreibacter arenae DSM 19593 TaxID=1123360 RepID=S9QF79_9RHOB|nr:trypsin-like serine protease [Litoreibacter arenae]EPX78243.1 macromolecule metabolism protein [Litoreibacter arenae DSM 19593]